MKKGAILNINQVSIVVIVTCFVGLGFILKLRGQPLWCRLGDLSPWTADVISSHNSQHLFDPYSFSHILHGFIFVWIFCLLGISQRYFITLGGCIETIWELLENSKFVIERYRAATISLNYYGDSIANSLADVACCLLGILLATRFGFVRTFGLFLLVEISMILLIRDSLIINIMMLIHPLGSIRSWQAG